MKKYKLIKMYPGVDIKYISVGDTFTEQGNSSYIQEEKKQFCRYCVSKREVENYPEFWEKVKEKEWEVLQLKNPGNNDITSDKLSIGCWVRDQEIHANWEIYSIKRLSDGEVFAVGDKLKFTTPGKREFRAIKRLAFSENHKDALLVFFEEDGGYKDGFRLDILSSLIHYKEPLFTTEDGVDIYEDEGCFGVCIKEYSEDDVYKMYSLHSNIGWHSKPNKDYWKTFSTKETAEAYIQKNKPKTVYGVNASFTKTVESKFAIEKLEAAFPAGNWKWFNSEKERDLYIEENKPRFSKKDMIEFTLFFDKESKKYDWTHIDQLFARWSHQPRKEK